MTDDQTAALAEAMNAALTDLARQVNDGFAAFGQYASEVAELATAAATLAVAGVAGSEGAPTTAPTPPPPLGEITVRLESGPSSRRVERDGNGHITRIVEEPMPS